MKHTNININSPYGQMKYYFEYINSDDYVDKKLLHYTIDEYTGRIDFYNKDRSDLKRYGNEWINDDPESFIPKDVEEDEWYLSHGFKTNYIPNSVNMSKLNLYFPRFSVETYNNGVKYALDINTYIHGRVVNLGSYLIDRNDVLACDGIKIFSNTEYYEYLSVDIIDPWYIIYDDSWKSFRQHVCGEPNLNGEELNSTGSVINISLHPVMIADSYHNERYDYYKDGEIIKCMVDEYREMDKYHGGQNAINLADDVSDYLSFHIKDNRRESSKYDNTMVLMTEPMFNKAYTQDINGFKEYIKETYQLDDYDMQLEIMVTDKDDIYSYIILNVDTPWQRFEFKSLHDEENNRPLMFDSWNNYHEGMFIKSFLHIKQQGDENSIIYLPSNTIAITKDLFRYMVADDYMFNRTQEHIEDNPIISYHNHTLRVVGDNVYVDGAKQEPDDSNRIYVDDMCFVVSQHDPCVMIGSRIITIVGNTITISKLVDSDYITEVLQPDENGFITIPGGKVGHMDDEIHNITFQLSNDKKNYHFYYAGKQQGIIEIIDGKVVFNGKKQTVNPLGYVWLMGVEGARFDIDNSDGDTYLSGRNIIIDNGHVVWGGVDMPMSYASTSDISEYPYKDGKTYIDKCILNKVYLSAVDMNVYNINAVNKIEQTVVKMDRVDDYKSNIIKPVFFRSHNVEEIIVHPAVIENICINLDAYKSKVDSFMIKIENTNFVEIGRNSAGVIFRIDGRSLPGTLLEGVYYILDSHGVMVTTGKYKYEI